MLSFIANSNSAKTTYIMVDSIHIHIGIGFFIGLGLTFVFLVTYLIHSDVGSKIEAMMVRGVSRFTVKLMAVPEVNDTLTKLIAGGINAWLTNPDAQDCINELVAKTPKEEAARELGKSLPGFVGNFTSGVIESFRKKPEVKVVKVSLIEPTVASREPSSSPPKPN